MLLTNMKKIEKKIAIEFDKKQYETLVRALQIAGSVYGIMGDMVDESYKKESEAMDDLESWVLACAGEFGMARLVEIFHLFSPPCLSFFSRIPHATLVLCPTFAH